MALRNAFGALALETTLSAIRTWVEARTGAKTTANSVSVNIASDQTVPVSAASLPLPSGAATSANQSTANTSLSSIDGKLPALSSGRVPVDVGSSINVGEVEVKNDTGNPVPVSGPLTDTQLRASAVPVSPSVQLGMGVATATTQRVTLATDGAAVTALTSIDGKTPALDSGYVPVLVKNGQLEVTNDAGNPLPVGPAAQLNVTGSASALNADLFSTTCDGYRSLCLQVNGTFTGTIAIQVSNDNTNWFSLAGKPAGDTAGNLATTVTTQTIFTANLNGYQFIRARFTLYTSGTASAIAYFSRESIPIAAVSLSPTNTVTGSTTTSGVTLYTVNSGATTNAANIKSTAANLYGISAMNTSATTKYVRFYSKATTPTVGTDVPIMVVAVPATSSKEIQYIPALRVATGLGVSITGGAAATDATAVAAGDVQLLVSYA